MKTCPKCKQDLDESLFSKNKRTKSGLQVYCKPCSYKNNKSWNDRQGSDVNHLRRKNVHLRYSYGIDLAEYNAMLASQGGVCAICKSNESQAKKLAVDHCHKTNKVRGLLCSECNTGLGKFDDNLTYLEQAIKYLKND